MFKFLAGVLVASCMAVLLAPVIDGDDEPADDRQVAPAKFLDHVQPPQPARPKVACKLVIHTGRPLASRERISPDCTSVKVVILSSLRNQAPLPNLCTSSISVRAKDVPVPTLPLFGEYEHPGENEPPFCPRKTTVLFNPR